MRSELIVCTRNRPAEVERLLNCLPLQNVRPRLIVVDSSDDAASEQLVRDFGRSGMWSKVYYMHTAPGLTRQRMCGIRELGEDCEIVHFLDDDVVLESGYFEALESACFGEPLVAGAGGLVTNPGTKRPRALNRVFLLDSGRQGVVLRSGVNLKVYRVRDERRMMPVEWLSGCSMTYKREIFARHSFDESMSGYSLGEDVDFSYAVSRDHALVLVPAARLEHLERGAQSLDSRAIARSEMVRRYEFVRKYSGHGVSAEAFWWSVLGDFLVTIGKAAFMTDRARWRDKLSGLREGVAEVRGRRRP